MGNSWSIDPLLWIIIGILSLAAILTAAGLIVKAFSFQNRYLASILFFILFAVMLTAVGLVVPLMILSGQTYFEHRNLLVDVLMMGISGLVVIAIASFIVDHLMERPIFLMLSAGACLAIALLPWAYHFFSGPLNNQFRISVLPPDYDVPLNLDEFNNRYLSDVPPGVESTQPASETGDPSAGVDGENQSSDKPVPLNQEGLLPPPGLLQAESDPDWLYGIP